MSSELIKTIDKKTIGRPLGSCYLLQSQHDSVKKALLRVLLQCYRGDSRLCKSLLGITQRNLEHLRRVTLSEKHFQKNENKSNHSNLPLSVISFNLPENTHIHRKVFF